MAEANPYAGPRWLAFLMAAIALVTLILGVVNTPLGEWTGTNLLFGALLVLFVLAFGFAGVRGSFNLMGRWSGKASMTVAVIGGLAAAFVIVGSVVAGTWDLDAILTTGMWVALFVMFVGGAAVARKKMQAGQ